MLKLAAREHNINLEKSFFVGDMTSDIEAGRRAEARTISVSTGFGGRDELHNVRPHFSARTLLDAVRVTKQHDV